MVLRFLLACWCLTLTAQETATPLLKNGQPVDWWFVFKFNAETFPRCGGARRACPFGGTVERYKYFGQQFVFASSADPTLQQGGGCVGDTTADPVGATFDEVYNGAFFYVLWNDQFYGDPLPNKDAPAGHSKGLLAWTADGSGMVLQVST
ncbi:MAG TPA: deoxyribonuclease II family protein, partial [Bryobacteraceae bacterium]|nr:deoxyribonuclease II family protein [Bryobacteraceae bacterium]